MIINREKSKTTRHLFLECSYAEDCWRVGEEEIVCLVYQIMPSLLPSNNNGQQVRRTTGNIYVVTDGSVKSHVESGGSCVLDVGLVGHSEKLLDSVTGLNNNEYQITRGEVIWESDLASESPVHWYLPLDTSHFSLSSFRMTSVGRFITKTLVHDGPPLALLIFSISLDKFITNTLEFVGLAPKGSQRVSSFLEKAADGFVKGGRLVKEIIQTH
ncbi:Cycloartenol-C-24-methyltransferase [Acorus gramineus]|uniref:Cycloartenol-C-24-methyltransferase n=1 Tax=Acorus gramineus TaxID=55184 RepID=A0AAV9AU86_ACOGR|nr:Cycloartenol-C-24-methyltransferase [Acorus gramineus]